uniref:Uncharacterized protein n=1 Tax=Globodera rostochiensis TaxID=31243 RepID=A0A914HK47_GLORO
MHNHHQQQNRSTSVTPRRRSRMASPPAFSAARLFAKLSGHQQQSIEQKMAELRAVYSTQPTPPPSTIAATQCSNGSCNTSAKGSFSTLTAAPRRPGRTSLPTPSLGDMLEPLQFDNFIGSRSCASSRRASTATTCFPAPSIMELASSAGLMSLSPSDLVFESSVLGIAYYDFVLSVCEVSPCDDTVSIAAGAVARKNKAACVATSTLEPPASACPRGSLTPAAKRRVHGTGSDPTQPSPAAVVVAQQQRKTGAVGGVLAKLAESGKKRPQTAVSSSSTGGAPGDRISLADNIAQLAEECETKIGLDSTDQNITAYRLLLAKLDRKTNVEWFESVIVPAELLERNGIPVSELSLLTMGILVWRCTLNNARLLCLVNGVQQQLHEDSSTITASFEALKRAACKYKCMHHVITVGQRRPSAASTHSSCSSRRSSLSSGSYGQNYQQDSGMKLRVLMCQSRSELQELPAHALRDAKFLLASNTNPLFHFQGDCGGPLMVERGGLFYAAGLAVSSYNPPALRNILPDSYIAVNEHCDFIAQSTLGEAKCLANEYTENEVEAKCSNKFQRILYENYQATCSFLDSDDDEENEKVCLENVRPPHLFN